MEGNQKRHPIQVVARRTGMTADRLRAWEKRYGVVEPARSDGGRRLYSDEDIELLRLLHRAILGGRRISRVAGLDFGQLSELVKEDEVAEGQKPTELGIEDVSGQSATYYGAALDAVVGLDAHSLEAILRRAIVNLSAGAFIDQVVAPLLKTIGDRWHDRELTPAHEHVASQIVRRVLSDVIESAEPDADAPGIVVATPAGQMHEFGALMVAATAAAHGWRVTYTGPDLPARDIASVAETTGAEAVAISLVYPRAEASVEQELRDLRRTLPADIGLIVGGGAAPSYRGVLKEIDASAVDSLVSLRRSLAALT